MNDSAQGPAGDGIFFKGLGLLSKYFVRDIGVREEVRGEKRETQAENVAISLCRVLEELQRILGILLPVSHNGFPVGVGGRR